MEQNICTHCGSLLSPQTHICPHCGWQRTLGKPDHPEQLYPMRENTYRPEDGDLRLRSFLQRGEIALEDEDWEEADLLYEEALVLEPRSAEAYLGKLMVQLKVRSRQELKACDKPFDDHKLYARVMRFGDEPLKQLLTDSIVHIKARQEIDRLEKIYQTATEAMAKADSEEALLDAAQQLETIPAYRDANALAEACRQKAEKICQDWEVRETEARRDEILLRGKEFARKGTIPDLEQAIECFGTISGWKDADACFKEADKALDAVYRRRRIIGAFVLLLLWLILFLSGRI